MSENPRYEDFVRQLYSWSEDPSKNFAHSVLGFVTEIHEYLSANDEINGLEELGDMEFYLMSLALQAPDSALCLPVSEDDVDEMLEAADQIGYARVIACECNDLLDEAKRWVGYGKAPDLGFVLWRARALFEVVNSSGPYPEPSVEVRQRSNMRKLLKRYPGGLFKATSALNRDTEAERAAIASS